MSGQYGILEQQRDTMDTIISAIPRTRTEALDQITAIENEFKVYAGTDFYKSDRANCLRAHIVVLDRLLSALKD